MEIERTNDLRDFFGSIGRIRALCRAKNEAARKAGNHRRRPCVDGGLVCFECQDELGLWPPAQGIVTATADETQSGSGPQD